MPGNLKFGLASVHGGENAYPDRMVRIAHAAERAGFDSVWAGGHPFLSEKQSRMKPGIRLFDPVVALSFIAARTNTIRLGTGILLLPQFNPVILAKELASLDVLSSGRLIFGIGVGWSEHEYEVLGVSYHNRGKRADDYLRAIKAIWMEDRPVYKGRYVSFDNLQSFPHPVQKPYPPVVVGGNSLGTFRRAVETANGWFGYGLSPADASSALAGLREAAGRYSRPIELGELEISVAPPGLVDRSLAEQYSKMGVHRLILISPQNADVSATEKFIENVGSTLIGRV